MYKLNYIIHLKLTTKYTKHKNNKLPQKVTNKYMSINLASTNRIGINISILNRI